MSNTPQKSENKSLTQVLREDLMMNQFRAALPRILPPDRFVRCLITTIQRVPELMQCDRHSVLAGAMTAAQLGLEIDPALGRAYLLPYKDKRKGMIAQLIIGYKGFIDLAYRSGQLSGIQANEVYENDVFSYEYGLDPKLKHIPANGNRGKMTHVYAVATMKNGGKAWTVLNESQVNEHRAKSPSAKSEYSPWNTHTAAMWRKTAIRSLAPYMPQSPELRDAIAHDDGFDVASMADIPEVQAETPDEMDISGAVQE